MTSTRLSTRQQSILTDVGAGAVLRYRLYQSQWRWVLGGEPTDARSVYGLLARAMVRYVDPRETSTELMLTDVGRAWLAKQPAGRV